MRIYKYLTLQPTLLGRSEGKFSDSVNGVKSSAHWYSLMETAKANGLEPYHYLKHVFERLPLAQTDADIDQLLPWNIDPESIRIDGVN